MNDTYSRTFVIREKAPVYLHSELRKNLAPAADIHTVQCGSEIDVIQSCYVTKKIVTVIVTVSCKPLTLSLALL